MIIIGLTGSIGMGKSTIGAMMETLGICVHEADQAVHALTQPQGAGYRAIVAAFPYFEYPALYGRKNKDRARVLDRKKFGDFIFKNNTHRETLESILHPLVQEHQNTFIRNKKRAGYKIIALDIPLLFETSSENRVDVTLCVSAPAHVQKARVMERAGMTEEKFNAIIARQMPDGEKCARADYIIHSGLGHAHSLKELKKIIQDIKS